MRICATVSAVERLKSHDLRARANRRQLPARARADQDQQRTGRRLFERLQQAIGARDAEVIGIIDNRHLAPPKKRTQANAMAQAFLVAMFFVADEQFDRQRRLVRRQTDHVQVRMIAGRKHAARFALAARLQARLVDFRAQQRMSQLHAQTAACRRPAARRTNTCSPAGRTPASGETAPPRRRAQGCRATC